MIFEIIVYHSSPPHGRSDPPTMLPPWSRGGQFPGGRAGRARLLAAALSLASRQRHDRDVQLYSCVRLRVGSLFAFVRPRWDHRHHVGLPRFSVGYSSRGFAPRLDGFFSHGCITAPFAVRPRASGLGPSFGSWKHSWLTGSSSMNFVAAAPSSAAESDWRRSGRDAANHRLARVVDDVEHATPPSRCPALRRGRIGAAHIAQQAWPALRALADHTAYELEPAVCTHVEKCTCAPKRRPWKAKAGCKHNGARLAVLWR